MTAKVETDNLAQLSPATVRGLGVKGCQMMSDVTPNSVDRILGDLNNLNNLNNMCRNGGFRFISLTRIQP